MSTAERAKEKATNASRRLGPGPAGRPGEAVPDDLSRGILTTEIRPRLARDDSRRFLAAIVALPVVQGTIELVRQGRIQALEVFSGDSRLGRTS